MANESTQASAAPAAPVTAAEPGATVTPSETAPAGLPSQASIIAKSIAAGHEAIKAAAEPAQSEAPASVEDVPAPPPVDVPPVPADAAENAEPAKTEEAPPDPMAALAARFEAIEKQNAALIEHLTKLTATPQAQPAAEPEQAKSDAKPADRKLADSPFEAQARDYFGDLPRPLLSQATEVLEKRHGWQMELRAAEAAAQGGDAAAAARVQAAQASLAQVARVIERIEFDAEIAKPAPAQPMAWGVTARDTLVDITLSEREQWPPLFQSLEDHEVASVLRGVTAGTSQEDYFARAEKALTAYATKRQGMTQAASAPPAAPAPAPSPKNPAPPAPAKPETTVTGDTWSNTEVPSRYEKIQRVIARARGDALAN